MGRQDVHAEERRDATDEEIQTLPHVADSISFNVGVALLASAAERFSFYAVTTPWQNYIQNRADSIAVPGALGLGQSTATNITSAFYFLTFLSPTPWAIICDTWLGRYKTLCLCFFLNFFGCLVMFVTSIDGVGGHSSRVVGLALAMILLGLGTGGVKATVSPFIGDQYTETHPQFMVTKGGRRVIVDRALTLQYIYNIAYWLTNIASLSLVASTYLEKDIGFWAAYLLPLCSVWMLVPLMVIFNKYLAKQAPQSNVLPQAARVVKSTSKDRFRLDSAKPAYQKEKYGKDVTWNDTFVLEIKRGLRACRVMACFVPFHLCMNQIVNNLVSQAGQMRLGGVPNDTIQALNSIACVLLGPVLQKGLYPTVRRLGINFGPIARITWAFILMSTSMAFAAGLQKLIYARGPCYQQPLGCAASDNGRIPNDISVWAQTPVYLLLSVAEILGFTTLSEYSYSEAPESMRSLVQALGQLSSGIGSSLGIAFSPLSKDPQILYLYTGLAVTMIMVAPVFWLTFRSHDRALVIQDAPREGSPAPPQPPLSTTETDTGFSTENEKAAAPAVSGGLAANRAEG